MTDGHKRKVSKASHHVTAKDTTNYGESGWTDYDSTKRYPKSIWTFAKDTQKSACHSTQKPVALIETSLDKGTQRKTTENELPSLTQCTA